VLIRLSRYFVTADRKTFNAIYDSKNIDLIAEFPSVKGLQAYM